MENDSWLWKGKINTLKAGEGEWSRQRHMPWVLYSIDRFHCFCSLFFLWVSRGKIKGNWATLSSGDCDYLNSLVGISAKRKLKVYAEFCRNIRDETNKNTVGSKSEELLSGRVWNDDSPVRDHCICLFSRIRQQLIKKMLEKKTTSYNSHPATLENNHLFAQYIAKGLQPFSVLNNT